VEGLKKFMRFHDKLVIDTTGLGDEVKGGYKLKVILEDSNGLSNSFDFLVNIYRSF
jgi:hypothetical protein